MDGDKVGVEAARDSGDSAKVGQKKPGSFESMQSPGLKRLHISPLDSTLLDAILPPTTRALATEISFHSIQTFPENDYGFVTLPIAEADRLIQKLNGSILKGKKLQLREARLPKTTTAQGSTAVETFCPQQSNDFKMAKKRKAGENAIEGHELPSTRRVKRGWTEAATKDKRPRKSEKGEEKTECKSRKAQKSKYTAHSECLFRTLPPPNKKASPTKANQKRKSRSGASVVHEFEKSTAHPSFLRDNQGVSPDNLTNEYVEGKGWLNRNGSVKEMPSLTKHREHTSLIKARSKNALEDMGEKSIESDSATDTSSSEQESSSSLADHSEDEAPLRQPMKVTPKRNQKAEYMVNTENVASLDAAPAATIPTSTSDLTSSSAPESDSSSVECTSDSPSISDEASQDGVHLGTKDTLPTEPLQGLGIQSEVHPLEALFKRPASTAEPSKPQLEVSTAFSFFGNTDANSDIEEDDNKANEVILAEPQTPFTKKDLQWRSLRSGAPTPDTAAAHKTKFWSDEEDEEDEEDEDDESENGNDIVADTEKPKPPVGEQTQPGATEESEFSKWFWGNRGDNNRAWKKRRREAAKEKRQRENRQRGRR